MDSISLSDSSREGRHPGPELTVILEHLRGLKTERFEPRDQNGSHNTRRGIERSYKRKMNAMVN